jgi:hypothetical protein
MGLTTSTLSIAAIGSDRPNSNLVATLPVQRVPTSEGASGLHYSGRVYANEINKLATEICDNAAVSPDKIKDVLPNSISSVNLTVDPSTRRINPTELKTYIDGLVAKGVLPGSTQEFNTHINLDSTFYANVKAEYCFYESRYKAALLYFINLATSPDSDTSAALSAAMNLNKRLNSLLEIINAVGNRRASETDGRSKNIQDANASLQAMMSKLQQQKQYLESSDVTVRTQEEMVRFSSEKSRAMNIQLMLFIGLNVVALGTIITVYKSMRPSV